MRRLWILVLTLTAACGGKTDPKPAPATAATVASQPAADAVVAADVAPAKPSQVGAGKAFLEAQLPAADAQAIGKALALADALGAEAKDAGAAGVEARVMAARVRLVAVAGALHVDPSGLALGEGGADKQLRLILAASDAGPEGKAVADAARGLLALAGAPDAGAKLADLRPILTAATPEAQALRLAALGALGPALDAGPGADGFATLTQRAGVLLCDGCRDAATLGPDQLAALAAKPWADGSGFTCAAADAKAPGSPCAAVEALAAVPGAGAGANVLALAALELEAALKAVAPGPRPLAAALQALADKPARKGVALPVAVAELGAGSLGANGLAPEKAALAVAVIGPDGVRIGTRALVAAGGAVTPVAEPLAGAPLAPTADILAAQPDPATGAVPLLAERGTAVAAAVTATTAQADLPPLAAGATALAILPGAPPKVVAAAADALAATGLGAFVVLRPGVVGAALPLYLRKAPAELEAGIVKTFDKPVLVVVSKEAVDVWGPEKPKDGGATIGADAQAEVPTAAEPGWRGETLARLRLPLPPAAAPAEGEPAPAPTPRLAAQTLQDVKGLVDFWLSKTKAGPVVHVVAGEGAESWDVLALAQAIQEAAKKEGAPALDVKATWPGARCPGEASDCASALVVAFSGNAVPSERGLTSKPKKGDKVEKPEAPPPSDEFCNKADIQTQMRKRAGSIRFCYEKELQLEKDLQGRLVAKFTIDLGGKVKAIGTSGDLPSKTVAECVKAEIKKVQFAPPNGGECVVSWPFQFRAN